MQRLPAQNQQVTATSHATPVTTPPQRRHVLYGCLTILRINDILKTINQIEPGYTLEDAALTDVTHLVIDKQCGAFYDQTTLQNILKTERRNRGDCMCCRAPLRGQLVTASQFLDDIEGLLPKEGLEKDDITNAKKQLKALTIQDGDIDLCNEELTSNSVRMMSPINGLPTPPDFALPNTRSAILARLLTEASEIPYGEIHTPLHLAIQRDQEDTITAFTALLTASIPPSEHVIPLHLMVGIAPNEAETSSQELN